MHMHLLPPEVKFVFIVVTSSSASGAEPSLSATGASIAFYDGANQFVGGAYGDLR